MAENNIFNIKGQDYKDYPKYAINNMAFKCTTGESYNYDEDYRDCLMWNSVPSEDGWVESISIEEYKVNGIPISTVKPGTKPSFKGKLFASEAPGGYFLHRYDNYIRFSKADGTVISYYYANDFPDGVVPTKLIVLCQGAGGGGGITQGGSAGGFAAGVIDLTTFRDYYIYVGNGGTGGKDTYDGYGGNGESSYVFKSEDEVPIIRGNGGTGGGNGSSTVAGGAAYFDDTYSLPEGSVSGGYGGYGGENGTFNGGGLSSHIVYATNQTNAKYYTYNESTGIDGLGNNLGNTSGGQSHPNSGGGGGGGASLFANGGRGSAGEGGSADASEPGSRGSGGGAGVRWKSPFRPQTTYHGKKGGDGLVMIFY